MPSITIPKSEPYVKPKSKIQTKTKGPDWTKAPKVGTTARTDWYKKFNLALDDTTPLTKKAKGSRVYKMKKTK